MLRAQSELGEPLGSTFWHFCFLLQQSLRISWAPRGPTQVGLDCVKVLPAKQRLQATRAPNQNDLHIKQKSLLNKYQKLLKDSVWPHLFFFCSPCCLKLEEKWKYIYTFIFFFKPKPGLYAEQGISSLLGFTRQLLNNNFAFCMTCSDTIALFAHPPAPLQGPRWNWCP